MDNKLRELIVVNTSVGDVIENSEFYSLIAELDIRLPDDYIEFLKEFNGCEGSLSDNSYIAFWSLNELKKNNEMYEVNEFAPELFLIRSDGGGSAYGFKRDDLTYIEVPFIGMSLEEAEYPGNSFEEFVYNLVNKNGQ